MIGVAQCRRLAFIGLGVLTAACSKNERSYSSDTTSPAAATRPAADSQTRAMAPAVGGMHADTTATKVEAHVQTLAKATGDSLKALVRVDRQVVTGLIADCEQMMRQMKMDPPRKWRNAVADLRQDLDKMQTMNADQLRAFVPDHTKRIEGMLSMRRDMMKM